MGGQARAPVIWAPHAGPQHALVQCPVFDVLFGGARGGGKTDAMLCGDWPIHAQKYGAGAKGLFVRRTLPELEAAMERAQQVYPLLGATWREQPKTWRWPNGALLRFRHLLDERDAASYQGHDYTRVYAEELTNWASPKGVDMLKATLRSSSGVPVGFRATANPGGPGHLWVKERYIDPAPGGYEILRDGHGNARVFIPSRVSDNPALARNDPGYVNRLRLSGSASLVRAWLEGDWNVVDGAYFDCWSPAMILRPMELPAHWLRFRAFDWGSARPFSVGWWAVASEALPIEGGAIPKGAMVRYREWYGAAGANLGLKLTVEQVAAGVLERERGEKIAYGVADPSIFAEDGGPSKAERMGSLGVYWSPADNKRATNSDAGLSGGWDMLRARMVGEDGRPMIYVFSTCADSIRTIPALQHDARRPEDLDSDGEDHAADEWRYAVMSRPWTAAAPVAARPSDGWRAYGEERSGGAAWKTV